MNPFREFQSYFMLKYYKSKRRDSRIEAMEEEKQRKKMNKHKTKCEFATIACGLQSAMQVAISIMSWGWRNATDFAKFKLQ